MSTTIKAQYRREVGEDMYWKQFLTEQIVSEVKYRVGTAAIHNSPYSDFKDIKPRLSVATKLVIAKMARERLKNAGEPETQGAGLCIILAACGAVKRGQL